MRGPQVSVTVPIFNRARDVAALISGLASQNYPTADAEYIIVDNRSTDETKSLIEAALNSPRSEGKKFRLLTEVGIQSSYAARNTGIRAAAGEIIAFTDSDCRPQPDWLSRLVLPFTDSKVGAVAGQVDPLSDKGWIERYSTERGAISQQGTLNHPFRPYGQTANLAVRREVIDAVGMFRPYLLSGGDADLCWRILGNGWNLQLATDAVVLHRHRSTISGLIEQYRRYATGAVHLNTLYQYSLPTPPSYARYIARDWGAVLRRRILQAIRQRQPVILSYALLDFICFHAHRSGFSEGSVEQLDPTVAQRGIG